eukprot:68520-Prymnesium_polylepis.2
MTPRRSYGRGIQVNVKDSSISWTCATWLMDMRHMAHGNVPNLEAAHALRKGQAYPERTLGSHLQSHNHDCAIAHRARRLRRDDLARANVTKLKSRPGDPSAPLIIAPFHRNR